MVKKFCKEAQIVIEDLEKQKYKLKQKYEKVLEEFQRIKNQNKEKEVRNKELKIQFDDICGKVKDYKDRKKE